MKTPDKKISIAKGYLLFSIIVSILIFALCIWFTTSVYKQYKIERDYTLSSRAKTIEKVITDDFNQITNFIKILGKLIVDNSPHDPKFISDILIDFGSEFEVQSTGSRTGFDWISTNDEITVNSSNGILKHPIDVSMRKYVQGIKNNPGQLFVDPASYGRISAEWIIPSAMGFTDSNGNYIGGLSLGFSVKYLRDKIENVINDQYAYYVILDNDFNIVLQASMDNVPLDNEFFNNFRNNFIDSITSNNNTLKEKIITENQVIYSNLLKIKDLPYTIIVGYHKNKHMYDIWEKIYPLILAMLGIGIVFLVLLRIFARNIIDPIVMLSAAADKISRGERGINFPENAPYEVHNLSVQLSKINRYIKRIKRIKKANEEAEILKEKAIKASQAKSDLLALVSHELRTPLNAIINFSEIQMSELFGPMNNKKYLEYSHDINESGKHLLQLINNILDITKAEANKIELIETNVNIKNIINICMRTLSEHAARDNISLSYEQSDDLPDIYADELCLKQIMINLMSNAVNYTENGGEVHISAYINLTADHKKHFVITVSDTGVGIDKKDINRVMEKFGQASKPSIRKGKGTGLGLPLTRTLVELHNGTLHLESTIGKGTKVTIRFPEERIYVSNNQSNTYTVVTQETLVNEIS